jgi:peptidyl-prolyl cis-trans isomerase C
LIAGAAACSKPEQAAQPAAQKSTAATPQEPAHGAGGADKPVPATLPDIVARINGESISRAEFERAIQNIETQAGGPVPPERRDEVLRSLLDQLVGYYLLKQEARTQNVTVSDLEVDARVSQIRQQYQSEEAFRQALATQKTDLEAVRRDTRTDMVVSRLVEAAVAPKISVQPADVEQFYSANRDQFKQGEAVRASHILVHVPADAPADARVAARGRLQDLLKQVQGGADFAALAQKHSDDPGSAARGGDLGFFGRGQMVPAFEQAAFGLKPGQLSGIIETPFGYHVIKVAERRPPRDVPLEEARPQIVEYLTRTQQEAKTAAFVDSLKKKAKIEIFI